MSLRELFRRRSALVSSLCVMAGIYGCSGEEEGQKAGPAETSDADSGANDGSDDAPGNGNDDVDSGGGGGGDGVGQDGGGGGGGADAAAPEPEIVTCPTTIVTGTNTLSVGSKQRSFFVDLPSDTSKPMAVIFSWHGYGQDSAAWRASPKWNPNQDPAVPAIIVTPIDTKLQPPFGLDWDIAAATPDSKNIDLAFFEAMVECLAKNQSIDENRLYSFGFSAGAVVTNMIHSRFPKRLAAIVTASGAWMNDKAQTDGIKIPFPWKWPALDPADKGNVLMTHGGPKDVTVLELMNLENAAQAAIPFLKAAQRTVVDCAHNNGHTLHPNVDIALMSKYLFAHRLGEPSPFAGGTLQGYPASCTLRLP